MTRLAIIGGSGLNRLAGLEHERHQTLTTAFGDPSAPLVTGGLAGKEIVFLARHGRNHTIAPHKINYRANIRALKDIGVERVVAVAAVGGITPQMAPATLVLPDQIIDYTWGRDHTFFNDGEPAHIDFTFPYCRALRADLLAAAAAGDVHLIDGATYGAMQGPRLETAAEINRLASDGCHVVGMTGMPEAALARELELSYACCAVVANWAAGRGRGIISMAEITSNLEVGMREIIRLLVAYVSHR